MKRYNHLAGTHLAPKTTCFALGLFDGLHLGHQAVIRQAVAVAREEGLTPCVFTFSIDVAHPVGKDMGQLQTEALREELLAALGVEVLVCPDFREFQNTAPADFLRFLRKDWGASALVCGENFHFGKGAAGSAGDLPLLWQDPGRVHILPLLEREGEPVSSTRIRQLIRAGEIPRANALLGHPFAIDFPVVHGNALGRTLGTPTINQPFPPGYAVPRFGVYASTVRLEDGVHAAVTNVGVRPTVGSDVTLAETYIHQYSGDLYGRPVKVEFMQFIRPERKFSGLEELKEQILRDSREAGRLLESL